MAHLRLALKTDLHSNTANSDGKIVHQYLIRMYAEQNCQVSALHAWSSHTSLFLKKNGGAGEGNSALKSKPPA